MHIISFTNWVLSVTVGDNGDFKSEVAVSNRDFVLLTKLFSITLCFQRFWLISLFAQINYLRTF